ncbi:MAG TPA: chromate efflux transporter [Caulobacteraceae bacterium]|jgi:chromate transporter|nr:chromate efflux transporter [Caulobacteraceae bacterium]
MGRTAVGEHGVSFAEAVRVWARVAALSFGGPAGQIAIMHRILVEEKRWIGERRFLQALNYCMLLPGPEAQQLAIYIGWLMHRTAGGLVAGLLFVLPGLIALMALSILYSLYGGVGPVAALFYGLKAAVLVLVLQAVMRVGRRALGNRILVALAGLAFVAMFVFRTPFPVVVLGAGAIGFLGDRVGLTAFRVGGRRDERSAPDTSDADSLLGDGAPDHTKPNLRRALPLSAILLVLWLGPVLALGLTLGWRNVYSEIGLFFSKMAVVTFGGAYAVLAYVAQEAVQSFHWLKPGEMLDGLGMAETTPGPLIMVNQFVGFMGALRGTTGLPPILAGVLGGLLTTWVTFTPCFIWIFLGAPYVEALREAKALNAALTAITAVVVGVILNLAVWFSLHVLFREVRQIHWGGVLLEVPRLASANVPAMVLSGAAAVALLRFRLGVIPLLLACSGAGVVYYLATGATPGAP